MAEVQPLPLADRPAFARKMLAVWRLHHLDRGEDLKITVAPGEWPDGQPREVKGVPVEEHESMHPQLVWVWGRARGTWRWAANCAFVLPMELDAEQLAITSVYGALPDDDGQGRLWLAPSPETGEVPMWTLPRGGNRG